MSSDDAKAQTSQEADRSRGDETRRRLLETALQIFGTRGFDAVGIRQIAEAAGVNVAAISYHFGGKEGLYLATAEHLIGIVRATTAPFLDQVREELLVADEDQAIDLLRQVMKKLTHALVSGPATEATVGFIYREQVNPSDAFDILYDGGFRYLYETISMIVARIRNADPDDPEIILVTHAMHGQVLAFRASRATILRRLDKTTFNLEDVERIAELLADLAVAALAYEPGETHGPSPAETSRS